MYPYNVPKMDEINGAVPNMAFVDPLTAPSHEGLGNGASQNLPNPLSGVIGAANGSWKRKRDCSFADSMDIAIAHGKTREIEVRRPVTPPLPPPLDLF